jgi:glutamine transport system permease protein
MGIAAAIITGAAADNIDLYGRFGGRLYHRSAGRSLSRTGRRHRENVIINFVELIRGTPIMVQVMFIYFALPMILPVRIDPITAAMVTIIINSGAYIAEITRGAILSINRGFKEASLAMGLSQRATLWHVIMPLALRRMIPALGNQWIISIKDTSLFIVIGVAELTRQGQEIIAGNFRALEVWTAVALIYLAVTLCLSFLLKQLEKRIHIL